MLNYSKFVENRNDSNRRIFEYFKYQILEIYLKAKLIPSVESLLLEIVLKFIKVDFPVNWLDLTDILKKFLKNDHEMNLKIFKLINKFTKKYHLESRSDPLYSEINHVIEKLSGVVLQYTTGYVDYILNSNNNIKLHMMNLVKLLKIFYNFIY